MVQLPHERASLVDTQRRRSDAFTLLKQYWNLSDLFVLPEFQGLGIGRRLLSNAISQAQSSSSCEEIWVNSSLNAELFYRTIGFHDRFEGIKKSENSVPLKLVL